MATTEVYLKGKVKWTKVHSPDQYGKWKTVLYPDAESLDKIHKLKEKPAIKNVLGKDEDGYFMAFSRPQSIQIRGKVQGMEPVKVLDASGNPLDGVYIGNGSDCTLKLEVYTFTSPVTKDPGRAARLKAIRVDNLVPYERPRDFTDAENKTVEGLMEQPKPAF